MTPSIKKLENTLGRLLQPGDVLVRKEPASKKQGGVIEREYRYLAYEPQTKKPNPIEALFNRPEQVIQMARVVSVATGKELLVDLDSNDWTKAIPKEERTDTPSLKER